MTFNRRQLLQLAAVGGISTLAASRLAGCTTEPTAESLSPESAAEPESSPSTAGDRYAKQIDAGLSYFKELARQQLPLVEALLAAIQSGDLAKAKTAYVESRPPYEQIEVLAVSFAQTDSDIDARPYAFDEGEASQDFKGFHRIEALLYRDQDLQKALPYAEGLVGSVKTLISNLDQRQNFSAKTHFEGMIALATEVAAKKISSEEETWSDQSLLIFRENWRGIYSQFEAFTEEVATKDSQAANAVKAAYEAALVVVQPYFQQGQTAAQPYSSLNGTQRGKIAQASYRLRDSLVKAVEILQIT